MGEVPDRRGLNAIEARLASLFARRGASSELLDGLDPAAARALRPVVEQLEGISEEQVAEIAGRWEAQDAELERTDPAQLSARGPWAAVLRSLREDDDPIGWIASDRMRRLLTAAALDSDDLPDPVDDSRLSAAPDHFDALVRMEPDRFREFVGDLGVYQAAELVRDRNRRQIARLSRQLADPRRELFVAALRRDREIERGERTRLREVFVTLSQHFETFPERAEQLGIYTVACAASRRFRRRIVRMCEGFPDDLAGPLARYYRLSYGSTRRGVARPMRESLEAFLRWQRERDSREEDDDRSDE